MGLCLDYLGARLEVRIPAPPDELLDQRVEPARWDGVRGFPTTIDRVNRIPCPSCGGSMASGEGVYGTCRACAESAPGHAIHSQPPASLSGEST